MTYLHALLNGFLDHLFENVVQPGFVAAAGIMDAIVLNPLQASGVSAAVQVAFLGVLTWCLSFLLCRLLRMDRAREEFHAAFAAEKDTWSAGIAAAPDQALKANLAKLRDNGLDDLYNDFLAGLFARNGAAYLLPVLLCLLWLHHSVLAEQLGREQVLALFLCGYGAAFLCRLFTQTRNHATLVRTLR